MTARMRAVIAARIRQLTPKAQRVVELAAAIGLPHVKWDERPLLVIVKKPGAEVTRGQVLDYLKDKIAKWWLPDDVVFADEIPHTATGKISKVALRERFRDYRFPS